MSANHRVPYDAYSSIVQKKARYGHCIDTKAWEDLNTVALSDASFTFCDTGGSIIDRNGNRFHFTSLKAFVSVFQEYFRGAQTLHMFGPPHLELIDEETVRARWAMEDQLLFGPGSSGPAELRGGGYYHEVWIKRGEEWWLKELNLKRTYTKVSNPVGDI